MNLSCCESFFVVEQPSYTFRVKLPYIWSLAIQHRLASSWCRAALVVLGCSMGQHGVWSGVHQL